MATAYDCLDALTPVCTETCADGRCSTSSAVCEDAIGCPASRPVRCPDGSCQAQLALCPNPGSCSALRCADGRCGADAADCAGIGHTCPADRPVRCLDGACRASLVDCPVETSCGAAAVLCADGRCAPDAASCLVGDGCPASAPWRCPADGTCSATPSCPTPIQCPGVRCADGRCVDTAAECPRSGGCPAEAPVRCPDETCRSEVSACAAPPTCPDSHPFRCADGSCRARVSDCGATSCPSAAPLRCDDGSCVGARASCAVDPCPGDRPFLCVDHSCVASPFHCRTYEALDDADGDGIDAAVDPAETQPGSTVVADGLALLVQSPPATRGLFFRWPRTQQGVGVEWELVSDDPTTPVALSARGWDAANGAPLPLFAGVADDYVEVVASAGAHASFASGSLVVLVHRGPLMLRLGSRVEISISDGSRVVVEEVGAGTQSVLHAADGEGQVIVAVDRAQTALAPGESIVVAGESVPVPGLGALGRVALALLLAAVVALPTRARRVRSG